MSLFGSITFYKFLLHHQHLDQQLQCPSHVHFKRCFRIFYIGPYIGRQHTNSIFIIINSTFLYTNVRWLCSLGDNAWYFYFFWQKLRKSIAKVVQTTHGIHTQYQCIGIQEPTLLVCKMLVSIKCWHFVGIII